MMLNYKPLKIFFSKPRSMKRIIETKDIDFLFKKSLYKVIYNPLFFQNKRYFFTFNSGNDGFCLKKLYKQIAIMLNLESLNCIWYFFYYFDSHSYFIKFKFIKSLKK